MERESLRQRMKRQCVFDGDWECDDVPYIDDIAERGECCT